MGLSPQFRKDRKENPGFLPRHIYLQHGGEGWAAPGLTASLYLLCPRSSGVKSQASSQNGIHMSLLQGLKGLTGQQSLAWGGNMGEWGVETHWTRAHSLDPYPRLSVHRLVYCYCDTQLSNRFLIAHAFLMWHYREVQNAVYPPATVLRLLFCLEFSFESWSHLQLFSLTMSSVATSTRIILNPDSLILPEG